MRSQVTSGVEGTRRRGEAWSIAIVTAMVAAAYVAMRFQMNVEFRSAPWAHLVALEAPLPFGHRVLVPLLCRPLLAWGLSVELALAAWEWVSVCGLLAVLWRTLAVHVPSRAAAVGAFGFLLALSLTFLLRHKWPIFYPWDTPAMLVVAAGTLLSMRGRFAAATAVVAVGALNRETALVIPAIALVLHAHERTEVLRRVSAWAGLMVVAYALVREGIAMALPDNPGHPVHFVVEGRYRVFANLEWLSSPRNALVFLGSLAYLPLVWWPLHRFVPRPVWRLHVLFVAMVCGLLVVGNAHEPRVFGEALVIGWVAVCVGATRWIEGRPRPAGPEGPGWLRVLDRSLALAVVALFAVGVGLLERWPYLPRVP